MKKIFWVVLVIVLVILLAVIYWQSQTDGTGIETDTTYEGTVSSTSTNPLDNKPNINPVDQTNPFKNIKTNPFE